MIESLGHMFDQLEHVFLLPVTRHSWMHCFLTFLVGNRHICIPLGKLSDMQHLRIVSNPQKFPHTLG